MQFYAPLTMGDCQRAAQVPLNERMYATSHFEGVRALHVFRQVYLKPLTDAVQPTPREEILLDLHHRITAFVGSARKMNATPHFQALSSVARSVFELGLDIALFSADQTPVSLQRVLGFNRVEKFKTAKTIADFYVNRPAPADFSIATYNAVAGNAAEQAVVAALRTQYWPGNRWPAHWSSLGDARSRAHAAGGDWEEHYVRHYARLSWHVHAGLVGVTGMPATSFDIVAAMAYALIEEVVLDSFQLLEDEFNWRASIQQWDQKIDFLSHLSAVTLADLRLQSIGEPPRLVHIEQAEEAI